jgi:hypothetical protein
LERLLELTREVDFAAFVFAHDDWTTMSPPASDRSWTEQVATRHATHQSPYQRVGTLTWALRVAKPSRSR